MSTQSTTDAVAASNALEDPLDIARRSRRSSTAFIVAVATLTLLLYSLCARGAGEQVANPTPSGPFTEQGAPRPHPPVFGFEYWPQVFEGLSFVAFVALWAIGLRQTYRRGRWSPVLTMTAVALTMSLLDPIMNWSPYASYNPNLLHYPESWAWIRLSPTVEPLVVWLGYTYYWLIPAWTLLWVFRKMVRRASDPTAWWVRRPMLALAAGAYPVCFGWDLGIELCLTRTGLIAYTQGLPGLNVWGGMSWQFPLLVSTFMATSIFMAGALMWQDDSGLTFAERAAKRFRVFRTMPNLGAYAITVAIIGALFSSYLVVFGIIRVAGLATEISQPWPYPETKVYDPQGEFERHGQPGPFMIGSWTGWERNAR